MLTDYPDRELLENLKANVEANVPSPMRDNVHIEGYLWGSDVKPLLDAVQGQKEAGSEEKAKFDLVILSDLVFNHSQVWDQVLTSARLVSIHMFFLA